MTEFDDFYQKNTLEILRSVVDASTFMSLLALEIYRRVLPEGKGFSYSQLRKITGKLLGNEIDLERLEKMEKYQVIDHIEENSSRIYFLKKFGVWFVENVVKPGKDMDYLVSSLKEQLHQDK